MKVTVPTGKFDQIGKTQGFLDQLYANAAEGSQVEISRARLVGDKVEITLKGSPSEHQQQFLQSLARS